MISAIHANMVTFMFSHELDFLIFKASMYNLHEPATVRIIAQMLGCYTIEDIED